MNLFQSKSDNSRLISRSKITTREKLKLWFKTLFYHSSFSFEYVIDTIMEPVFWFVDHFTHILGPAFVTVVVFLISCIVVIAHFLGLPFWYQKSPLFTVLLIFMGYWILINLAFNFYQVATTSPGTPTDFERIMKCTVTICKKCISPKPPRTHHCSICNLCYLNMDHHCPWLNNCIGHYNRRYFFLTMVYIVAGCCFIMLFGVELAFREIVMDESILPDCGNVPESMKRTTSLSNILKLKMYDWTLSNEHLEGCDDDHVVLFLGFIITRHSFRYLIYFAGLLCIGTALALGGLTLWHAKLILMGETSIEYQINKTERKKTDQIFVNAYDLGRLRNLEVLLGLDAPNVSFFSNILLPSSHKPTGDGYNWDHITSEAKKRWQ